MFIARTVLVAAACLAAASPVMAAEITNGQPPPATDMSQHGGTLSDKLDSTAGVIHPEGSVDPTMAKPAPATGTMPVIPPGNSPGVPPGAQPK